MDAQAEDTVRGDEGPVIRKSGQDDREYRLVTLPNGIRGVVIHDATTDKAAATVCVHVGSLSDPPGIPGLAHFCEHSGFACRPTHHPAPCRFAQFPLRSALRGLVPDSR